MAKEWILNQAMNRWGLNKKRCVGAVSALIRKCGPSSREEWERTHNVDFCIAVGDSQIGIQIKPISFEYTFESHKWEEMQRATHAKFTKAFGGKVFTVHSTKQGSKKVITNPEVIESMKEEIGRLGDKG